MSVKSFKFVSPGVFVNEVDNSQLPRLPEDMGPVIIGRAERGPAMVPVKIDSFSEFVETFGEPIAGAQADDAWRQGNRLGPTYGAFAAQAYLRNGSPITFVRLLGEAHPDVNDGEAGEAGWNMPKAWGLYVDDGAATDKLAAILYTNSTNNAAIANASVSAGNISIDIIEEGTGTPATSAVAYVLVDSTFTAANLDHGATNPTFKLEGIISGGLNTDIDFDVSTDTDVYNPSGAGRTRIGVLSVANNDSVGLAKAIARGINALTTATASVQGQTVTIVAEPGLTSGFIISEANTAGFLETTFSDGTAEVGGVPVTKKHIFNFNRNSKLYIRDVLNTNPTLTNSRITATEAVEPYFLGPTFDQFLASEGISTIDNVAVAALTNYEDNNASSTKASSPWVLSQYMGSYAGLTREVRATDLTKLFRFHSLYGGAWEQRNFKISISDIKPPANDFTKYGSFTVLIRDAKDNDASPVVLERYSNVNLDPSSNNYVATAIGDMEMLWDDAEKRYEHVGEHANQSRFIRIQMADEVSSGAANPELLPFAFAVPSHSAITAKDTAKFVLRTQTANETRLSSSKNAFFGISTDRVDAPGRFDGSYQDIVRPFLSSAGAPEDMFSGTDLFSLDLIVESGSDATFALAAANTDALDDGTSINAVGGDYADVLDAGYNKFTLPLCGGVDGLDITEIEPFCDDITGDGNALSNYAYNSVSKAIDIVADPEVVECNMMAIPGVATPGLTGKLVTTCEARGDALAIIDLEDDYKPRGWVVETSEGEKARLPNVSDAVDSLKGRGLNSSYGCAFFPWVQVNDQINNRNLWVPPSVVALGTMASSAAKSELWFAPAGFTRGGLSAGAGGLPVTQVRARLSSKERDALYEANINPIAQFPAEGIVVFGQKTLQVTPSALDRINVRRLMIHVKKEISRMAATVLFDQNVEATWLRFLSRAEPFLAGVKARFGLTEYRIILDETTTTPELVDRNIMYAKIYLKPARAIEFIALDFVITNTGASFDD
jgi:hypothetical protein